MRSRRRRSIAGEVSAGENHERWFVSYADFITLLFAFFTVMYALSSVNESKYRAISESLSEAFGPLGTEYVRKHEDLGVAEEPIAPKYMITAFKKTFTKDYRRIQTALTDLETDAKINVNPEERGIVVSLQDQGIFSSGSADIIEESMVIIDELSTILVDMSNQIRIEGHTDNLPISTPEYPSNWELSSMRALNILRYMAEVHGIATSRLSATGYGEHRPVASNDTPEGRARNRRIDIVILNRDAAILEP